jgi:8-oxo-dGTP pyrophosphatase MutT (NUDIX family)
MPSSLAARVAAPGKLYTLVFVLDEARGVLLGMKKRGFGVGLWNGFGGKVEAGESVVAAAARELSEEAGIAVAERDLTRRAMLRFEWRSEEEKSDAEERTPPFNVSVYTATRYAGTPVESDEMKPKWFATDAVPLDAMWEDDRYWLPAILASGDDALCVGIFRFASPSGGSEMLSRELATVGRLPPPPVADRPPLAAS